MSFDLDIVGIVSSNSGSPLLGWRGRRSGSLPLGSLEDGEYRSVFFSTHDGLQHDSKVLNPTVPDLRSWVFRASGLH